ncbi:hypothetical protein JYK22_21540, partial [Nonomuraea sp. RK-328]|nr:hypothetical protein [Nonomuraea sp. RK-328]
VTDALRQRYAEALAATNTLDNTDLEYTLDLVMAVRDDELESLRERAETAEAAIARVRALHHIHNCEADGHILDRTPNPCVNDDACHGCHSFSCSTRAVLDDAKPETRDDGEHA